MDNSDKDVERTLGELIAQVRLMLKKLDNFESKYNGFVEKTIRNEENINELSERFERHIDDHEKRWGARQQIYAAIVGSASGAIITFVLMLVYFVITHQ